MLTGILIGIFLAPAPGAETRKKLMKSLGDLRESAEEEAAELVDEGIGSLQAETSLAR